MQTRTIVGLVRKIITVVALVAVGGAIPAQGQEASASVLDSARAAVNELLVQEEPEEQGRVRSVPRTAVGIGLIGAGLGMALYNQKCALVGPRTDTFLGLTWEYRAIERDGKCLVGGEVGIRGDDGQLLDGAETLTLRESYVNFEGDDTTAKKGRGALSSSLRYTGVGMAIGGALITAFWSTSAPSAMQNISVTSTRFGDGVQASKTWSW